MSGVACCISGQRKREFKPVRQQNITHENLGTYTILLGYQFQWLIILSWNFYICFYVWVLPFTFQCLKLVPCFLSCCRAPLSLALPSWNSPLNSPTIYWWMLMRSPEPSLPQEKQLQLAKPLLRWQMLQSLMILLFLYWICPSVSMSRLHWGAQTWTQCTRCVSLMQSVSHSSCWWCFSSCSPGFYGLVCFWGTAHDMSWYHL